MGCRARNGIGVGGMRQGGKGVRGLAVGRRARMTAHELTIPTYTHTYTQHTFSRPSFLFFSLTISLPLSLSLSHPPPPPLSLSYLSPSNIAAHFICENIYTLSLDTTPATLVPTHTQACVREC